MIASTVSPLLLLLVLACPLLMVFMMRGHGHAHHGDTDDCRQTQPRSLDELRSRRDDLDAQIRELEDESERLTTVR